MTEEKLLLIYGLVDPNSKQIKYIGKSSSGLIRPKSHSSPSSLKKDCNSKKVKWIISLLENDKKPEIVVLDYSNSVEENNEKEIKYIKQYREAGFELFNILDGGNGLDISNHRKIIISVNLVTKELKEHLSIHHTAKYGFSPTKVCAVCKGRKKHHKGHFFYYKDEPKEYVKPIVNATSIIIFDKFLNQKFEYKNIHEAAHNIPLLIKTIREYCRLNIETKRYKFSRGEKGSGILCQYCGDNIGNCECDVNSYISLPIKGPFQPKLSKEQSMEVNSLLINNSMKIPDIAIKYNISKDALYKRRTSLLQRKN